jgi:hypothetical protein
LQHEASVPSAAHSPFTNVQDKLDFFDALKEIQTLELIPEGYGVLPEELENGYPVIEILKVGFRGQKELQLELPLEVWFPRAVCWVQALDLLTRFEEFH